MFLSAPKLLGGLFLTAVVLLVSACATNVEVKPFGISVDSAGNVYVVDATAKARKFRSAS